MSQIGLSSASARYLSTLQRKPSRRRINFYSQLRGDDGLGALSFNPFGSASATAAAPAATGSIWGDLAKTVVGGISQGVANKIGGHAPAPVTVVNPAAPGMPPWQKLAIGAGIALPVVYLVTRRRS